MKKKMKIGIITGGNIDGVHYHRFISQFDKIKELVGDNFDYEVISRVKALNELDKFDLITFNRFISLDNQFVMVYCMKKNIPVVMDIDDYWYLPEKHDMYGFYEVNEIPQKIVWHLKNSDYVTTTTAAFADKIKQYNNNVAIFPNCIDKGNKQWLHNSFNGSNKINFGILCGYQHLQDIQLLEGLQIPENAKIILCGYSGGGTVVEVDGSERQKTPDENDWNKVEKILTNNYTIVSHEYKQWLLDNVNKLTPTPEKFYNEKYERRCAKPLTEYPYLYDDIDVLLVPLVPNDFNRYKSELKLIECGTKGVAAVVSNVQPYNQPQFQPINIKGGELDKNGSVFFTENRIKEWNKVIRLICNYPEIIDISKNNLQKVIQDKYNINKIAMDRYNYYQQIIEDFNKKVAKNWYFLKV